MKNALQVTIFALAFAASPARTAEWHQWDSGVGNGHFYTVTDETMSWFDARGEASTLDGYLTSIGSIEELNFFRTTFGRTELFCTGLSTINGNSMFEWESGEPVTFSYFGSHAPNSSQLSAIVINTMNSRGFTRGGFLDVALGGDPQYRAIIESNTDPNAQSPGDPNDPPTSRVPDGGSTVLLMGIATIATGLWRSVRRRIC
jgi:hypothetical protein